MVQANNVEPLLVPSGTRLLHIGPSKTGTTSLQGAMWAARAAMRAQGVRYVGRARHSGAAGRAVVGCRGAHADDSRPPRIAHWDAIVREVRGATEPRLVFSSEFLAQATPEVVRRVVTDLGPGVHVVVTLRALGRVLPSRWQQGVQAGATTSFTVWLESILGRTGPIPDSPVWRQQRHDLLIQRWAAEVGVGQVTAVVLPDDHGWLLRVFEDLLGLDDHTLSTRRDYSNRSLTLAEAEAVRALNRRAKAAGMRTRPRTHLIRDGAARFMKLRPAPADADPVILPRWAADRTLDVAETVVAGIRASGVRVVGDLDLLRAEPDRVLEAESPDHVATSPEIAAEMALGVALAAGAVPPEEVLIDDDAHPSLEEPVELGMLTSREIAGVLQRRSRRSASRWLWLRLGLSRDSGRDQAPDVD